MFKIIKRYYEGFDYLTTNLAKLRTDKSIPLLIFTLGIYPLSIFVLVALYIIGIITIILSKSLSLIK